jgi:hypothetical protein
VGSYDEAVLDSPEFREELQSLSSEEQLGLGGPLSPILEVLIDKRMEV